MGRPLNKKIFGNRNTGTTGTSDNGIGGEGVASITLGGTNNSSGYALNDPIDISAPNLPGGVQATAKVTALGAGNKITEITVTEKGSGYTSVPTVTESVGGVQGTLTFTAVLTSTQEQSLIVYAQTTSGGSRKIADIIAQKGSTKFRVKTADGTATCSLRTDGGAGVGGMDITATDSAGGAYWVYRITAKNCVLVRKGSGGGTQFTNMTKVPWTLGAAVANVSVTIANA